MKKSLLLGSLLLAAAGGFAMTPPPLSANQLQVAQQEQQAPAPIPKNTGAMVLDHGAAERQQLRLSPTEGSTQRAIIRTAMTMAMNFGGQSVPAISLPTIEMIIDVTVDKVDDDGTIHATMKYTDITLEAVEGTPAGLSAALERQLSTFKGSEGKMVLDDRGNLKEFQFDLPEATNPNQQQLIDQLTNTAQQLSSPLPEEAVGLGALWQVPQSVTLSGININQIATYKLLGYQDNVMELELGIKQDGDTEPGGIQGLPAGTQVTLDTLTTTGKGQLSQDLGNMMATTSNVEAEINMVMKVESGAGGTPSTIEADVNMNVSQTTAQ